MTRNDIIKMAREAGFECFPWAVGSTDDEVMFTGPEGPITDELARFAALVAQAEREACAVIAESQWTNHTERLYGDMVAAMIRGKT